LRRNNPEMVKLLLLRAALAAARAIVSARGTSGSGNPILPTRFFPS